VEKQRLVKIKQIILFPDILVEKVLNLLRLDLGMRQVQLRISYKTQIEKICQNPN